MSNNSTASASVALARPALANPDANELATLRQMGSLLAASGFCKGARTEAQAVALILMGREMGLPAMQALSTIHVIEGKPTMSVHLMGAMLARGGVTWEVVEHSETACRLRFHRAGWAAPIESAFTVQDAQRAGLTGKGNWRTYPRPMLYARAFTEGARMIAPDLLCGVMYAPEELGADVDADGSPVTATRRNVVDIAPVPMPVPDPAVDSPSRAEEPDPPPPDDVPEVAAPESERLREALLGVEKVTAKPHLVSHYRVHYLGKNAKALGLTADEGKRVIAFLEQRAAEFGVAGIPGLKRLASEEADRRAVAAAPSDDREPGSDG